MKIDTAFIIVWLFFFFVLKPRVNGGLLYRAPFKEMSGPRFKKWFLQSLQYRVSTSVGVVICSNEKKKNAAPQCFVSPTEAEK